MDDIKIEVDAATEAFKSMLDKSQCKLEKVKFLDLPPEEQEIHRARLRTVASLLKVCRVYIEGGGLPSSSDEVSDGNNIQ